MWQYLLWIAAGILAISLIKIAWDKLTILLKGKRIAVLGERRVGKTHLIKFLSNGTIPMDYEATLDTQKEKGRIFDLKELKLVLKDMRDFSGEEAAYGEWKREFDKADLVFYLFRADRFFAGNKRTKDRVYQDLDQLQLWFDEEQHKDPIYFIIGTHCDFMPEYNNLNPAKFNDKMLSLDIASELKLYIDPKKIILGSMKNMKNTEELVYRLFYQIQEVLE